MYEFVQYNDHKETLIWFAKYQRETSKTRKKVIVNELISEGADLHYAKMVAKQEINVEFKRHRAMLIQHNYNIHEGCVFYRIVRDGVIVGYLRGDTNIERKSTGEKVAGIQLKDVLILKKYEGRGYYHELLPQLIVDLHIIAVQLSGWTYEKYYPYYYSLGFTLGTFPQNNNAGINMVHENFDVILDDISDLAMEESINQPYLHQVYIEES